MSAANAPLENFREKKAEVTTAIASVASVAKALGADSLDQRISKELVLKLEEDRFHLVVVGEFNHGKTTFVNALLGASVLPTGVTPTTATIHHLRYGDEPSARVVTAGGSKPIDFESVKSFIVGGTEASESVERLEVDYPAPLLRERIVLVDTPGVNDLSLQRADITYSYIPRSDAVLFLLDAGQILKESERAFLQDKIIGQSRDKIVFVITKWDLLSADEQEEALAYARTQLGKIVRGPVTIFPVSAQIALSGDREGSGIAALTTHLMQFLAEQRGRILLDNALGEALSATTTLAKGVDARRRALAMDDETLGRRISSIESDLEGQGSTIEQRRARVREEIATVRAWAKRDVERFAGDGTRVAIAQIDGADPNDLKLHYQAYLEQLVRDWAEAESKEIGTALEQIAERTIALVRDDAEHAAKRVGEQLGGSLPGMKVEIDSTALDFGVMATLTLGVAGIVGGAFLFGGVMLIAAPLLAILARDRIQSEFKRIARDKTPTLLRQIAAKIGPEIDAVIDEFAKTLDAWVVSAGEELHRELLEVLRSVRQARTGGIIATADARAQTEVESARLVKVRADLEALRASLWIDAAADVKAASGEPPQVNAQGGAA